MRPIAYLTLGLAPCLALFIYLYYRKNGDRAFCRQLMYSYLLGTTGTVALFAALAVTMASGLIYVPSIKRILFFSFVVIGGSSELAKFVILRYFILNRKEIRRPIDVITHSIIVALGFSTTALLLFAFNAFSIQSLFPVTAYSFMFVFANILFSVIMGFFVGMARFIKGRFIYSLTGLFGAAFFHGIFNFCLLTADFKLLSLFSFGSTLIVFFLGIKAANTEPEPGSEPSN